ncbi:hypothetical protein EVC30_056 [Rhizobium phage RHph_Y1_11]|nr:hypothetical protein EVC30_056 [Rhizobium phage RHph_Y1_11]
MATFPPQNQTIHVFRGSEEELLKSFRSEVIAMARATKGKIAHRKFYYMPSRNNHLIIFWMRTRWVWPEVQRALNLPDELPTCFHYSYEYRGS